MLILTKLICINLLINVACYAIILYMFTKEENTLNKEISINMQSQNEYIIKVKDIIDSLYVEAPPLAHIHSFGCQQNVSDGEKIKGMLAQIGYGFTDNQEKADLIIYNTCAVRENAESRVFGNIGELKHLKAKNNNLIIGICGCMAQQQHIADKIKKTYPQVDLVFGTYVFHKLPEMLYELLTQRKRIFNLEVNNLEIIEGIDVLREDKIKASVPIMYGCNNFCTYCIVPYVRGREKSRKPEEIICEVKRLVSQGYKEITLLGQNVNSYANGFPRLLRELNKIEGDFRIRFVSSHPKDATNELIDAIIECDKVCKHLHLPFQAGSNRILKAMNRKYTIEDYYKIVDYARSKKADFSFSSDIIVGFPGETFEEYLETVKAIKRVGFDNLYTFVYSKRSGTKAAELSDDISDEIKGKWLRELLLIQREIVTDRFSRYLNKTVRVLVEGEGKKDHTYLAGKNNENIIVEFKGDKSLIGQFVDVRIDKITNWALLGEIKE